MSLKVGGGVGGMVGIIRLIFSWCCMCGVSESCYIVCCLQYFVEAGAMAVRRCKKADLKRIAKATGAAFLTSLSNMEGAYHSVLCLAQCSCGRCILQFSVLGILFLRGVHTECSVLGSVLCLAQCSCGGCTLKCSVIGTLFWKVHIAVFCAWHNTVTVMEGAYWSVLCLAHCSYCCGRCMLQCSVLGTALLLSWKVCNEVFCVWHIALTLVEAAYCSVLCLA
jgi:hypothetical protein